MEATASVIIYFRRPDTEWCYVRVAMSCPEIGIWRQKQWSNSKFSRKLAFVDLTEML